MADGQFNYTIIKCSIYMTWQSEIGCELLARDDRGWKPNNLTERYSLGVSSNYSLFFFNFSWLFIIHDRLINKGAVLFLIPLTLLRLFIIPHFSLLQILIVGFGAIYSTCVLVYTSRFGKYPLLFTSTPVNNCYRYTVEPRYNEVSRYRKKCSL